MRPVSTAYDPHDLDSLLAAMAGARRAYRDTEPVAPYPARPGREHDLGGHPRACNCPACFAYARRLFERSQPPGYRIQEGR